MPVSLPSAACSLLSRRAWIGGSLAWAGAGAALSRTAAASESAPLALFGPGGPAPAMEEAARAFEKAEGVRVTVTAGPPAAWRAAALREADLLYSGSESMMSGFIETFGGEIDPADVVPLYLRPLAILVRPGNPRHIRGLADLLRPGVKVMVVEGAGQSGAWEDAAARRGDIATLRALRRNIVAAPPTAAAALSLWAARPEIDAWITWTIWHAAQPASSEVVPLEPAYRIYRDTAIVPTRRGKARPETARFIAFLQTPAAAVIFRRWGWLTAS
jgi:accessory colonization factor AcfC